MITTRSTAGERRGSETQEPIMNACNTLRGFGLVELLVGAAILSITMLSISDFFQTAHKMSRAAESKNQVSYLLEEGVETLKLFRDTSYTNYFIKSSTSTPYYFLWDSAHSTWATTTTSTLIDGKYNRFFTLRDVKRDDVTKDISTTGTVDPNVKLATVTVSWPTTVFSEVYSGGILSKLSPEVVSFGSASGNESGIVVSPDGKSAYAVKENNSRVYMYSRNLTSGVLTASTTTYLSTGSGPKDVAISPDGLHVYTANSAGNSISGYRRDVGTGMLTSLGAAYSISVGVSSLVISPDGLFVYALSEDGKIYRMNRNVSTGGLSGVAVVADVNPNVVVDAYIQSNIIMSPDGTSVYCTGNDAGFPPALGIKKLFALSRNTSTGALTSLGEMPLAVGAEAHYGVAISPDGKNVYITNFTSDTVSMYARNASTGMLTLLTPQTVPTETNPQGIVVSNDGKTVYVANFNGTSVSQYTRAPSTGLLAPNTPTSIPAYRPASNWGNPDAVAISPDDNSLYATDVLFGKISMYSRGPVTTTMEGPSASSSIQVYITNIFSN